MPTLQMEKTSQSRKRKEMADEKEEMNAKRRKLAKDIDRLEIHADSNIQIAAETGNLGLMKDAHEKRKEIQAKKVELNSLTTQIEKISVKIKNA